MPFDVVSVTTEDLIKGSKVHNFIELNLLIYKLFIDYTVMYCTVLYCAALHPPRQKEYIIKMSDSRGKTHNWTRAT